jgi:uncharacterized membrane protein YraQ (UPF0718 family)
MHSPAWLGDASLVVISLLVQGIPFLLLGSLFGALVSIFTPWSVLLRSWPRHPVLSAVVGAVFGLFIPACDCAAVPVVRRLVKKGVPLSAAIAYLLAAPELNPICLLGTYFAYHSSSPWQMVALRAGGSFVVAVVVGVAASFISPSRILRAQVLMGAGGGNEAMPWMEVPPDVGILRRQAATILAASVSEFIDISALYVLGALCTAAVQTFLPLGKMVAANGAFGIPMSMTLAFLFSLCSAADAFVVNAFGILGLAGQLAFLWLGPVYNLRVLFLYRNILRIPAIIGLGLLLIVLIGGQAFALAEFKVFTH